MKKTRVGFFCPKCWNVQRSDVQFRKEPNETIKHLKSIHVVNNSKKDANTVLQRCPKCGNNKALKWVTMVSGEHAGVKRERIIEHFRCSKCSYKWAKST